MAERNPDNLTQMLQGRGSPTGQGSARSYIVISIAAAVVTIGLKTGAFLLTGSVGLFSDAAESVINLVAALMAFWMLTIAARPADQEHAYGHTKAEYFSSGLESTLIMVAAAGIAWAAIPKLLNPQQLQNIDIGLLISMFATAINAGAATILLRAGKRLRSISLVADAHHLFTDVLTSIGVLVGVFLVSITNVLILDPIVALLVAANIVWTGGRLMRDSALGLLDTALPADDRNVIKDVFTRYQAEEAIGFHALRTRMAGRRRFISMHVLVPGNWSVQKGHAVCEQIERDIVEALPGSTVFTHLEPVEDPVSWADQGLDREAGSEEQVVRGQ